MAVHYTKVNFDTKKLLVPQNDVRYREVSAISVRCKKIFLWDCDCDSIRSYEYCPLYRGVFYKACPL